MSRTDELYQMVNALLALEMAEKTQQMPTQQMPTQQMPTQQMPTYSPRHWNDYTQTQQYDINSFSEQIKALTQAVQSGALAHSEQPKPMTADDALAAIINPPRKGESE